MLLLRRCWLALAFALTLASGACGPARAEAGIETEASPVVGLNSYSAAITQSCEINGNTFGDISQNVVGLTAGTTYTLSWAYAGREGYGPQALQVYFDGKLIATDTSDRHTDWSQQVFHVVATSSSATLEFKALDVGGLPDGGNEITAVSLTAPEYTWAGNQTAATVLDFTGDALNHLYAAGSGDTTVTLGAGGGSVHLGAGVGLVTGTGGKDSVTFGSGIGTYDGTHNPGHAGFIFVAGQISDAVGGHYDTITNFHGAGLGWSPNEDFISLKGFSSHAGVAFAGDIAAGRHLYTITDQGGYTAHVELDYAGHGVSIAGQWQVIA